MRRYVSPTGVVIMMGDEAARAVGYQLLDKPAPKRRGRSKPEPAETDSDD